MTEAVLEDIARGLKDAREQYAEEFPLLAFQTKSGRWWPFYEAHLEQLRVEFPELSKKTGRLEWAIEKAWSWSFRRDSNRKTDVMRFLRNFLRKE